jgi:hypothetical protein
VRVVPLDPPTGGLTSYRSLDGDHTERGKSHDQKATDTGASAVQHEEPVTLVESRLHGPAPDDSHPEPTHLTPSLSMTCRRLGVVSQVLTSQPDRVMQTDD